MKAGQFTASELEPSALSKVCRCGKQMHRPAGMTPYVWRQRKTCSTECANAAKSRSQAGNPRIGAYFRSGWRFNDGSIVHEYSAVDLLLDAHAPGWRNRGAA